MRRPHESPCDHGITYGDGRRGRCTCGAVAEELTADQLIRVIALRATLECSLTRTPDAVVSEAQIFEDYIRGEER